MAPKSRPSKEGMRPAPPAACWAPGSVLRAAWEPWGAPGCPRCPPEAGEHTPTLTCESLENKRNEISPRSSQAKALGAAFSFEEEAFSHAPRSKDTCTISPRPPVPRNSAARYCSKEGQFPPVWCPCPQQRRPDVPVLSGSPDLSPVRPLNAGSHEVRPPLPDLDATSTSSKAPAASSTVDGLAVVGVG